MKKMQITSILVLLLALCSTIAAVSASDLRTVPWKGTIFIGEEDLNIMDVMTAGNSTGPEYNTLAFFGSGSNPYVDSPQATINGVSADSFYVSPSQFNDRTGAWYIRDGSTTINVAFYVEAPALTVRIWNIGTSSDVTGQNVPRSTFIDFKIDTNLYQIQSRAPGEPFDFDIDVINPDGTTYSSLATESGYRAIENVAVDSSLSYWAGKNPDLGWDLESTESGDRLYKSGKYTVKLECGQNSLDVTSPERTFTIATDSLEIATTDEDQKITRGNAFTVKVTGQPKTDYYLFIKSTQATPAPYIILNQKNVQRGVGGAYITESGTALEDSVPKDNPDHYYAEITLDSSGMLSVGFQTTRDTDTKKYTIRVENKFDGNYKSDEIYMTVTEGTVTLVSEGDGQYFLGDQIELTGSSTESTEVYFFITGPNLPSNGGRLTDPKEPVINGDKTTFDYTDLDENDDYGYTWNTDDLGIDSGTYTIYAVATACDKYHLSDTAYATLSISLKKPYLSANMESNVANGDTVYITGDAGTEPPEGIAIWILGKNYATRNVVSVDNDATFEYEITSGVTADLASGQYYVVIQHPMYNGIFDVTLNGKYVVDADGEQIFKISGSGSLQGSDAAFALIDAINDADIDDQYTSLQFYVDAPTISINAIPDTVPGHKITVSGVTNLKSGNELLIEILSSTFEPTKKTQSGEFSGGSQTVIVKKGSGMNTFTADFSTTAFKPDTYIVQVSGIVVDASSARSFNVVTSTPTPTPTPTTVPTTAPTTIPTTATPTPTPAESPGFGALIAMCGLGVVAFLVVRKN